MEHLAPQGFQLSLPDSKGRYLVVGDIHGQLEMFQRLLRLAEFDDRHDFVYALGDLIDRGPDSRGVLDWFAANWGRRCASIMGNHEALMLEGKSDWQTSRVWEANGGGWAYDLGPTREHLYRCMLNQFPIAAEIEYLGKLRVGLIHAEVMSGLSWSRLKNVRLRGGDATADWLQTASACAIWGRTRFSCDALLRKAGVQDLPLHRKVQVWDALRAVKGIDLLICGHSVIDDYVPRQRENVLWIDSGAAYGERLTMVDPLARTYWQVGPGDEDAWGPLPLPEPESIPPSLRPTRKERAQVRALEEERREKARVLLGALC